MVYVDKSGHVSSKEETEKDVILKTDEDKKLLCEVWDLFRQFNTQDMIRLNIYNDRSGSCTCATKVTKLFSFVSLAELITELTNLANDLTEP